MLTQDRLKIGFLFAGQGSQQVSMGYDFYNEFEFAKNLMDEFASPELLHACFYGPIEKLTQTTIAQPALLMFSYAISQLLTEYGIVADLVAGLSLGEITACTYAKAFSFKDAMKLVTIRSQLMEDALKNTDSTMMAVFGLEPKVLQAICERSSDVGVCTIATYSYPNQIIVSGDKNALLKAKALCLQHNAKRVVFLSVAGGFHSPLLKHASTLFLDQLNKITINPLQTPVVFNTTANLETENITTLLSNQLSSTLYFEQSLRTMLKQGVNYFIEISPKKTLSSYLRNIVPSVFTCCISTVEDFKACVDDLRSYSTTERKHL